MNYNSHPQSTTPENGPAQAPFVEILPGEIPASPNTDPLGFLQFCKERLVSIGIGLPNAEQQSALYQDIDLMVFCGFDAAEVQDQKSFGDRRETWGVKGSDFEQMAQSAAEHNRWETHSTVSYAQTQHENTGVPALAVYDGAKMQRITDTGDKTRHMDEFTVADGFTMDEAVIAVFYLPSKS